MPDWMRQMLEAARVDGAKSSSLNPLQWLVAICFTGTAGLCYATSSPWIAAGGLLLTAGLCTFYCVAYWRQMKDNPNALRSERYSLSKLAMEKGLIGDNLTDLINPRDRGGACKERGVAGRPAGYDPRPSATTRQRRCGVKTRLIVIADDPPLAGRQAITGAIKAEGAAWWHWFQSAWLINDWQGRGSKWWRNTLRDASGGASLIVFEVGREGKWSGYAHTSIFKWIKETWTPD